MGRITSKIKEDPYRLGFHLMPPSGWMNDPNGLCEFQGKYHVFFQYSPEDVKGGKKQWGHYIGDDLLHFSYTGSAILPDGAGDADGAFSGSALISEDEMLLYYTGNVEQPGDHDYTYSGRESNTILVRSKDGVSFSEKQILLRNADYPEEYTCHVRDPQVWQQEGKKYMMLGGRLDGRRLELRRLMMETSVRKKEVLSNNITAGNGTLLDQGAVIVLEEQEENIWKIRYNITTAEPFGYMWECPDYFEVDGKKILSCSPQGLESEEYRHQNAYQSGYFMLPEEFDITDPQKGSLCFGEGSPEGPEMFRLLEDPEGTFHEWDMGFDFYAPRTFQDSRGRRILIGWAGMADADYDNLYTTERGWQHALTVPRVITAAGGRLRQWPVEELESLRRGLRVTEQYHAVAELQNRKADIIADGITGEQIFRLAGEMDDIAEEIDGDGKLHEYVMLLSLWVAADQIFELYLERAATVFDGYILHLAMAGRAGRGRGERKVKVRDLRSLRLLLDTSLAEIFVNEGEEVLTTRFYAMEEVAWNRYRLHMGPLRVQLWDMRDMQVMYGDAEC